MKNRSFKLVELFLYYLVIFFILREWLVPIMELTGTGHMKLILLFIGLQLAMSLFKIHFLVSMGIKLAYIGWFIVYVYSGMFVFSAEGLQFLINELQTNLAIILQADWVHVTDPFRTFLFLILIWMLIYLIHHWITVRMSVFYFLVLTVFFIGTLDTFTEYDGSYAIIKIVLLGLIVSAFLYLKRLIIQSGMEFSWMKYIKIVLPIVLFIGLSGIIAVLLPKSDPQWPDPVPFLKSATGQGGNMDVSNGVSKVGYGDNDSRLGGAFLADDTVVFLAEVDTKQYWRVETKDVYTSKGWEKSDYFKGATTVYQPDELIHHSLPVGPEEESKKALIQMQYPYEFIVQPYGLQSVGLTEQTADSIQFFMNDNTEKITPTINNTPTQLTSYTLQYSKPVFLYSDLKKPSLTQIDSLLQERYLQLPDSLPNRVGELARKIIEGKETAYDKARAIEMYFKQNGFRYDTDNVAVPSENQDYVDQFLFETKVGYCDNFSTSMVVLLRSVGVPARWVKGFAGGDIVDTSGEVKRFQVTNNDAHSWVEAYIPNVGWVNFEPTIGFNNTRSIDYDLETNAYQQERLTIDEDTEPDEVVEEKEKQQTNNTAEKSNLISNLQNLLKQNKWLFIVVVVFLAAVGVLVYRKRRIWLPKVYLKINRHKTFDESSFESVYLQLLKVLEMRGFRRKTNQTLQSFAEEVDTYFGTNQMMNITLAYEQYIYGDQSNNIDYAEMKESWEYLINRTSS